MDGWLGQLDGCWMAAEHYKYMCIRVPVAFSQFLQEYLFCNVVPHIQKTNISSSRGKNKFVQPIRLFHENLNISHWLYGPALYVYVYVCVCACIRGDSYCLRFKAASHSNTTDFLFRYAIHFTLTYVKASFYIWQAVFKKHVDVVVVV